MTRPIIEPRRASRLHIRHNPSICAAENNPAIFQHIVGAAENDERLTEFIGIATARLCATGSPHAFEPLGRLPEQPSPLVINAVRCKAQNTRSRRERQFAEVHFVAQRIEIDAHVAKIFGKA